MPIADDFAATVRSLFRFREKETQNFFSASSAPLLFLCADETQLEQAKDVGNSMRARARLFFLHFLFIPVFGIISFFQNQEDLMTGVSAVSLQAVNAVQSAEQVNKPEEISLFARIRACLQKAFSFLNKPMTWVAAGSFFAVVGLAFGFGTSAAALALPFFIPAAQRLHEQRKLEKLVADADAHFAKHKPAVESFKKTWEETKDRLTVAPLEEVLTVVQKMRKALEEVAKSGPYKYHQNNLNFLETTLLQTIVRMRSEPSFSAIREWYREYHAKNLKEQMALIVASMQSYLLSLQTSRAIVADSLKTYG